MTRRVLAIRGVLASIDFSVIVLAFAAASWLSFGGQWMARWDALLPHARLVVPLYALTVVAAILSAGLYRTRGRWSFSTELRDMARIGFGVVALTMSALYLFKLEDVSRQFLVVFFALIASGAFFARACWRLLMVERRRRGRSLRRILIVGSGPEAEAFAAETRDAPELGITVGGFVNDTSEVPPGGDWLGKVSELPHLLADGIVDEVAICVPLHDTATINAVVEACKDQGKDVRIPVRFMDGAIARAKLEQVHDLPVLSVLHTPSNYVGLMFKRVFDVVGAAVLLVVLAPLMATVALAILVADGRPVLFRQVRGGIHGRVFGLYKFRTMVRNAEALRETIIDLNEREGPTFKVTNDPRVTRLGRFLRRTSLDELPQLLNVLLGHMSLVGPRPAIPHEIAAYQAAQRRRLSVKPGITGLWQVSARTDPDFDLWVGMDLDYIDKWTIWSDVRLLSRTPAALFKQAGS